MRLVQIRNQAEPSELIPKIIKLPLNYNNEKKPICTRCWQKDLQCRTIFRLKWESTYRDKGIAFGRSRLNRKPPDHPTGAPGRDSTFPEDTTWVAIPTVQSWAFVNNDTSLIRRLYAEEQGYTEPHLLPAVDARTALGELGPREPASSFTTSPPDTAQLMDIKEAMLQNLQSPLSLFPSLDDLGNQVLFDYYVNQICPRTVQSPLSMSPFASVILPYCVSAPPTVLQAIQALAACHWSQSDPRYSELSLQLKARVLNHLRHRINTHPQDIVTEDPEILVIMMFLCLYDIVDDCNQQWIIHLQGAKDIIRLRRRQQISLKGATQGVQQDPVSSFTELFFAFQDVMGRTACGKAELFGSTYWREEDTTINPWMGCSPALVSILFSIMDLSRSRRHVIADEGHEAFNVRASALINRLKGIKQEMQIDGDSQVIQRIAELKRVTSIVYLNCALYGLTPSDSITKTYVRKILKDIVELLAIEPACQVVWPLFVAAVELDPLDLAIMLDPDTGKMTDGRRLVLELLMKMSKSSVFSVTRARVVIEQVWKSRDFCLSKSSRERSPASITDLNDWEEHVMPVSDALSLA
ncbi:hypothetical protein AAWM_10556 [Aspergillus awamori]|uniref:Uncharacterized protein n=1 Tax=Aspergillus awamori TaxID=105351 RepID=A0A401L7W9_ASPAW|nr:hypothetical protein AAWM_10556 [Aspergillus awamori]